MWHPVKLPKESSQQKHLFREAKSNTREKHNSSFYFNLTKILLNESQSFTTP